MLVPECLLPALTPDRLFVPHGVLVSTESEAFTSTEPQGTCLLSNSQQIVEDGFVKYDKTGERFWTPGTRYIVKVKVVCIDLVDEDLEDSRQTTRIYLSV